MSKHKRLFLFAGYDKQGIIDDAMVFYVRALSKKGDVIVCMDSTCKKTETNKIKPYVLHTIAKRHGEYDFGSYKRAYQYARDKKILNKYDHIYLVNDSVFGPLCNITQTLKSMEQRKTDAVGMVVATHKTHSYMESWFVRINKKIFSTTWFDNFISSVQHEEQKYIITVKYEHGLTNVIRDHKYSWGGIYTLRGRFTYNHPKKLFKRGCPFIKKACFTRHNGAAGAQIKYILNHCNRDAERAIRKTANRVYGEKYMNWLLTSNPIKIMTRGIKYAFHKLGNGGI
jgi:lipopolysaccharide biosynthesis protein